MGKKVSACLNRVFEVAQKLSDRISEDAEELTKKPSESDQSEDSTLDCFWCLNDGERTPSKDR